MSMLDTTLALLRGEDVYTKIGWNGFGADAGTTTSISDGILVDRHLRTFYRHGMGDFTNENGPIITDFPFRRDFIGQDFYYVAKLKREHILDAFIDEMLINIIPKPLSRTNHTVTERANLHNLVFSGPWCGLFKRSLSFYIDSSTPEYTPVWTPWSRNLITGVSWMVEAKDSKYALEPMLTDTFHIEDYNPAIPFDLMSVANRVNIELPFVVSYRAVASGQPTFTTQWNQNIDSKSQRNVTAGRHGRILFDMTGRQNTMISIFEQP